MHTGRRGNRQREGKSSCRGHEAPPFSVTWWQLELYTHVWLNWAGVNALIYAFWQSWYSFVTSGQVLLQKRRNKMMWDEFYSNSPSTVEGISERTFSPLNLWFRFVVCLHFSYYSYAAWQLPFYPWRIHISLIPFKPMLPSISTWKCVKLCVS